MLKPISTHFFNRAISFLEVALISSREKDNDYFNTAEYSNVTAYLYTPKLSMGARRKII